MTRSSQKHSHVRIFTDFLGLGLSTILLLVASFCGAKLASAQVPAAAEKLTDVQSLIRQTVNGNDPQAAEEIIQSAKLLLDVELYDDVKVLLKRLQDLKLSDAKLASLIEATGSSFFTTIFSDPNLQPEGRAVAAVILQGARRSVASPESIEQLIDVLNKSDISVRSSAIRKLRLIGEPAVAQLLNSFANEERVKDFPGIRTALKALAGEQPGPVLAGASASDPQIRLESIRALAPVRDQAAIAELYMAVLTGSDADGLIRSTALDAINARDDISFDSFEIEQWFLGETRLALSKLNVASSPLDPATTAWDWDRVEKKVVPLSLDATAVRSKQAQRLAEGLYKSNPHSDRNRELYLLALLDSQKRTVGPEQEVDAKLCIRSTGSSVIEINSILQRSINLKMYPAAIAACEILKTFGDDAILFKNSGPYPPLVNAILTGDRSLQFAALDAIKTLDPKHAFSGGSHVVSLAAYLASSYGQPKALIGHHRLDVAQTFAASVASSGVTGDAAMTGRELFEIATTDPDVEVILVSDSITRPSSAILIQQLRSDWRTRKMPIALMFSDLSRRQRALIRFQDDPTVVVLPFAADPNLIAASVDQLVYKVATFRQSRSSRIRHAKVAVQWLERIASDRKTFRFFELGPHQDKLQALIYRPGFAGHVSSILASVATPSAQRQLVNFASQNALPAKQRQHAAAAFSKAVKQTGVLLTRDEILLQYDRYNASEKESPATQQVLSTILDAIEAKKE